MKTEKIQFLTSKMLIDKSRECHNHRLQPTSETKSNRKMTKKKKKNNVCKINENIDKLSLSSQSEVVTMQKGLEKKKKKKKKKKTRDNKRQDKTQHETPVVKNKKPHKIRITPGRLPKNGQ